MIRGSISLAINRVCLILDRAISKIQISILSSLLRRTSKEFNGYDIRSSISANRDDRTRFMAMAWMMFPTNVFHLMLQPVGRG